VISNQKRWPEDLFLAVPLSILMREAQINIAIRRLPTGDVCESAFCAILLRLLSLNTYREFSGRTGL